MSTSRTAFTSNDASDVTIRQTAFTMSSPRRRPQGSPLVPPPTRAPSPGEVALDCNNTATFPDATGAIRLMTGAQTLEANVLTSGTGETGSAIGQLLPTVEVVDGSPSAPTVQRSRWVSAPTSLSERRVRDTRGLVRGSGIAHSGDRYE